MDFTSALDTSINDIEPPKLLPIGTYVVSVTKPAAATKSGNGAWEILNFPLKVVSAEDDVDPDDLEEFGKVAGQPLRHTFMFPTDPEEKVAFDRSMFYLKQYLENTLQLQVDTIAEGIAESVNAHHLAVVKHIQDKNNPEIIRAEVSSVAPLMD